MTAIPPWATSHLDRHLPAGNPVVNAHRVRRNLVLANTRLGAVLVRRGLFTGIQHIFLEVPSQKTAFRCASCQETLQFYNLDIPNDVFCSLCAARYHVDAHGLVFDAEGKTVPAEFKPKDLHPFPPVWDVADRVRDRVAKPAKEGKGGRARRAAKRMARVGGGGGAFRHNGFTLYARETATKGGARTLYFFSKGTPKSGEPSAMPDGYAVGSNARTGLPFLRKAQAKPGDEAAEAEAAVYEGQVAENGARRGKAKVAPVAQARRRKARARRRK